MVCRLVVGGLLLLICDRFYMSVTGVLEWLDWLYFLCVVKVLIVFLKYVPQAYFNFRRKSTKGWSIGTVLLDLFGGFFSLAQMVMIAWDFSKSKIEHLVI